MTDPQLAVGKLGKRLGSCACATLLLVLTAASADPTNEAVQPAWQSRVTPRIQAILQSANSTLPSSSQTAGAIGAPVVSQSAFGARYDAKNRLQIDVEFDCAIPAPSKALAASGMIIGTIVKAPPLCVVEGWAIAAKVPALATVPGVTKIDLPHYSRPHPPIGTLSRPVSGGSLSAFASSGSPAIDGNGITIMNVDKYVQQTRGSGTGVTIGVISDDAVNLALIQSRGELPLSTRIVQPSANPMVHSSFTDEGTMMLEEVYAVAPGATMIFCGPLTYVEYLGCMQQFIAAGATVVSDDLSFAGYDVMAASNQNMAAQALENILIANPALVLFTAVGNNATEFWQGPYNPFSLLGGATCTPSGQPAQTDNYFQQFGPSFNDITWQTNGGKDIFLTSSIQSGQATANNLDLYVFDSTTLQLVACATSASGGTVGSTSYTVIDGSQIPPGKYLIVIGSTGANLSGTFLKLAGTDDATGTSFSPSTTGAPMSPQDFASGVVMVGAVIGIDGIGNSIESFSNTGPIQLAIPSSLTLQAPQLVAPDAIYVDNSGTLFPASGGTFFGTSAASPNSAGVAALIRSAFPTLTSSQIVAAMENGASLLGGLAPNATFGYGRVDAIGTLAMIPGPSLTGLQGVSLVGGSPPTVVPFTVGGTGVIKVSSASSANLTGSGSIGVTVSPANCGNPVTACTLTLAPAAGSFGNATIQVTASDGANRTQSPQVAVAVAKPASPTVTITSGGSQSVVVNGAIAPINFTLTGTGNLVVTNNTTNVASFTISSGCGSTTMSCTVNLGAASSTAGTATVVLTVKDGYAQSASVSASVSETNPPSKSGGGGLDRWTLMLLGCVVLLHAFVRKNRSYRPVKSSEL
jgi:Subtilase family